MHWILLSKFSQILTKARESCLSLRGTCQTTIFSIAIYEALDESIFRKSALDIQQMNKRHEFYAAGLGKLYKNKVALTYFKDYYFPIFKLQRNFFGNLDLNLYFFKSHPRERLGVEEFGKYLPIFLPFFLLGFFYVILKPSPKFLLYFITILSSTHFFRQVSMRTV